MHQSAVGYSTIYYLQVTENSQLKSTLNQFKHCVKLKSQEFMLILTIDRIKTQLKWKSYFKFSLVTIKNTLAHTCELFVLSIKLYSTIKSTTYIMQYVVKKSFKRNNE